MVYNKAKTCPKYVETKPVSYMNRKKREIATMMPKMKPESRIYKVQLDPPRQRDTLRDL